PGGLAIMQDPDGRVHFLEMGDETEGFTVSGIERDHVTFTREGLETAVYLSTSGPRGGSLAAARREFLDDIAQVRERLGEETPLFLVGDRLTVATQGRYVNLRVPPELLGELDDLGVTFIDRTRESTAPGPPVPPPDPTLTVENH